MQQDNVALYNKLHQLESSDKVAMQSLENRTQKAITVLQERQIKGLQDLENKTMKEMDQFQV